MAQPGGPCHGKLTSNLTTGGMRGPVAFGDGGVIRGGLGAEIGPELLLALGNLFAADGALGLGHSGGEGARMLAQAAAAERPPPALGSTCMTPPHPPQPPGSGSAMV